MAHHITLGGLLRFFYMSILHYLGDLVKAAIPGAVPFVRKKWADFKITRPEDNSTIEPNSTFKVGGTFRARCGYRLVLLHHHNNRYWPQRSPTLDLTRNTWESEVHVGANLGDRHFISIAAVSSDLQYLMDYYGSVGYRAKNWFHIEFKTLPEGLEILHTIRVQPIMANSRL
jgi:hypothetical protein